MSAAELLEQVKALPASELRNFLRAVLSMGAVPPAPAGVAKRVRWPDIEARARRIFGDRVVPNLVLLEREESMS